MARTMLNDKFWGHAFHTIVRILNIVLLRMIKIPMIYGQEERKMYNTSEYLEASAISGSKCYIKREDKKIGKFDSQVNEGIFVGYSSKRKAYKCYNLRLDKVIESI